MKKTAKIIKRESGFLWRPKNLVKRNEFEGRTVTERKIRIALARQRGFNYLNETRRKKKKIDN